MDAKKFSDIINDLEEKPRGTLRFFGKWFGRPYDNHHEILKCHFKEEVLEIEFDAGETVKISEPEDFSFNDDSILIHDAAYVELSRYAYGSPQTDENLIIDRYSEKDVETTEKINHPAFELF